MVLAILFLLASPSQDVLLIHHIPWIGHFLFFILWLYLWLMACNIVWLQIGSFQLTKIDFVNLRVVPTTATRCFAFFNGQIRNFLAEKKIPRFFQLVLTIETKLWWVTMSPYLCSVWPDWAIYCILGDFKQVTLLVLSMSVVVYQCGNLKIRIVLNILGCSHCIFILVEDFTLVVKS